MRELDVYPTPLGPWATAKLDEAFRTLSGGADGEPRVLRTQGRSVAVYGETKLEYLALPHVEAA